MLLISGGHFFWRTGGGRAFLSEFYGIYIENLGDVTHTEVVRRNRMLISLGNWQHICITIIILTSVSASCPILPVVVCRLIEITFIEQQNKK